MTRLLMLLAATVASAATPVVPLSPSAAAWWRDITVLADDRMEGRQTGSPGYLRAADYVEQRFKAEGLAPAGEHGGYRQSVALVQQTIDSAASHASLTGGPASEPLIVGQDLLIGAGGGPRASRLGAPMVFIGYGLHLPERGHDDFAGVDLKGRIAVVISGGPADIPGPVKAAARFERATLLAQAGAVGLVTLTTPKQVEIPWARLKLLSRQPGMYLADPSLRDVADGFLTASVDPTVSQRLFEGSGRTFEQLSVLADASQPLPSFALARGLEVEVAATRTELSSPNLIAKLVGSDPRLRGQYVAVSAHLDHLGIGEPVQGDRIYNGAMDDGSGVASVLDIAHQLATRATPLRRSVLFVIVTAEEKGLLGSHYLAVRPTTPRGSVVADLNFDMALPL